MPKPRRRSNAELPPHSLELAHPLAVPGAEMWDAVVITELPQRHALAVWQMLRVLTSWLRCSGGAEPCAAAPLAGWEERVLREDFGDDALWAPLGVLAGELQKWRGADPEALSGACWALADWALGQKHVGTALLFAEAGCEAWPNNARIAWLAGRLYRRHARYDKAEVWLRRAARVAVWTQDWYTQGLALNGLGLLQVQIGQYAVARRLHNAALRIARRYRLREVEADTLHHLFVINVLTAQYADAEKCARDAYRAYGPEHPAIIDVAFDVSHLWVNQGQFARALQVLTALLPHFKDNPDRRLRVLALSTRASGALRDLEGFQRLWQEAWALLELDELAHLRPTAALSVAQGALNLSLWTEAGAALDMARRSAEARRESDTLAAVEAALDQLRNGEAADLFRGRLVANSHSSQPADVLARNLAHALKDEVRSPGDASPDDRDHGLRMHADE